MLIKFYLKILRLCLCSLLDSSGGSSEYTPKERNFLVMVYQKVKGTQSCSKKVTTHFLENFPSARVPTDACTLTCWWSTCSRIATKDLSYHGYKMERSQGLKPEDLPRRMRFSDTFVNLSRREMANIAYSDEATFSLDGEVNIRRYAPKLKMYCHQSKWGDSH